MTEGAPGGLAGGGRAGDRGRVMATNWSPWCPAKAGRLFDVAHGWAAGEDGVVRCVLCGATKPGEPPPAPTEDLIPILLTREHWDEISKALIAYANILGITGPNDKYIRAVDIRLPLDHQLWAVDAQLRAQDAGEGE